MIVSMMVGSAVGIVLAAFIGLYFGNKIRREIRGY
jgi:hypothetical protein